MIAHKPLKSTEKLHISGASCTPSVNVTSPKFQHRLNFILCCFDFERLLKELLAAAMHCHSSTKKVEK